MYAKPTEARLIDQRARRRATQALIDAHRDEFSRLYAAQRAEAEREACHLAATPEAAEHYRSEPVRLMTGRRQPDQKAGDRIDVARCAHCVKHHDRSHVCPKCGAAPNHSLTMPDDGVLDEVAIERAMTGEPVKLTSREREEATRLLAAKGHGVGPIAATLRMSGARVAQILGGAS